MSGGDEIGQHVSLATKLVSQEPKGDIMFSFFNNVISLDLQTRHSENQIQKQYEATSAYSNKLLYKFGWQYA